jgi:hypothetical protein
MVLRAILSSAAFLQAFSVNGAMRFAAPFARGAATCGYDLTVDGAYARQAEAITARLA